MIFSLILLLKQHFGWSDLGALSITDARVILEARDGALWIGTYFGLARMIDGTTRVWTTADGLSTNRIRALHQDATALLRLHGWQHGPLAALTDWLLTRDR